jgi:hypothetical protein
MPSDRGPSWETPFGQTHPGSQTQGPFECSKLSEEEGYLLKLCAFIGKLQLDIQQMS